MKLDIDLKNRKGKNKMEIKKEKLEFYKELFEGFKKVSELRNKKESFEKNNLDKGEKYKQIYYEYVEVMGEVCRKFTSEVQECNIDELNVLGGTLYPLNDKWIKSWIRNRRKELTKLG